MTTTTSTPTWTPWTSFYDSAGQAATMVATVGTGGSNVKYDLDRFILSLQDDPGAPSAGAIALSGALSVDVPEDFTLAGFLLQVDGHIDRTDGAEVLLTCSIGPNGQSRQWTVGTDDGATDTTSETDRSRSADNGNRTPAVEDSDFHLECFTSNGNLAVGTPPYPPVPPFPVTLSIQGRCRTAEDSVQIDVLSFTVVMLEL